MALPVREQAKYWGIVAVIFCLALWFLGDVLLPFIVGGAIAYMMDPLADRLERLKFSRAVATATISLIAVLVIIPVAVFVFKEVTQQALGLFAVAPEYFASLQKYLSERFPAILDADSPIGQVLSSIGNTIKEQGTNIARTVLGSAIGVINAMVFVIVVPVVAFYLLLDWDNMIARIDALLPRDHRQTIRDLAAEIDTTLASFVRGQLTVCAILGTFYAVTLMIVGLQFGLVVGVVAGLITFIPYVGALVGGALAIGLALFQFWAEPQWIVAVAVIFGIGQFLEGNILTPKLVGQSVGLHPVWLLFALSAFGSVFGFVGMLVAVPVAAMFGVLTRFGILQYQGSSLYRGLDPDEPEQDS
ncbi:MAG: AI-2E family transporter [Pseudomonadota bacterium]